METSSDFNEYSRRDFYHVSGQPASPVTANDRQGEEAVVSPLGLTGQGSPSGDFG